MNRVCTLILIVISFGAAYQKMKGMPPASLFVPPLVAAKLGSEPRFASRFVSTGNTRIVHAPSVVELKDGRLMAFWFAGSREGAKDVEIHSAVFESDSQTWESEQTAITRADTYKDIHRYVKKLGNPVVTRDPNGKLWLFFVSVSFGGWSCSSINVTTSSDQGLHWSPIRKLVTSPFLNISSLVKTAPFYYQDGTMGLPIYHEMATKFGELLRLNQAGRVISKTRLNTHWQTLQPLFFVQTTTKAVALMRYGGSSRPRLAIGVETDNAGFGWSEPFQSVLPNPDSAMAGIVLTENRRLVVINNNQQLRDDLTLLVTENNGQSWQEVYRFEDENQYRDHVYASGEFRRAIRRLIDRTNQQFVAADSRVSAIEQVMCTGHPCWFQFEYPYLIRAKNGMFHLVYTWNQTYIKHVEFNQEWLEKRILERVKAIHE